MGQNVFPQILPPANKITKNFLLSEIDPQACSNE